MLASYLQQVNPYDEHALAQAGAGSVPDDISLGTAREALFQLAAMFVKYDRSSEAYKLYRALEAKLPSLGAGVAAGLDPALVYLGFAALPYFSQDAAVAFFKERNISYLLQDYDLLNIRGRISSMLMLLPLEERDKWRKALWEALHENQNKLAAGKSIGAWLKEYDGAIGFDVADSYRRAEFEAQSASRAHLGDPEKRLVHRLIDLYEFIKLSSLSPAGYDEDVVGYENGEAILYTAERDTSLDGAPTPRPQARQDAPVAPAQQPLVAFSSVVARSRAVLAQTNGDAKAVRDVLEKALRESNAEPALASLLLLAQLRVLDSVLLDDERFRALVLEDLKKSASTDAANGFAINPTAPQFVARFLKIALEARLALGHEDAARFGEKLGQVLALEGEKYGKLLVRDATGVLKWNI